MKTKIISIIAILMAVSCQQESLDAVIIEEYDDLEAISFHDDTITFGDSIRVRADFKRPLSNDARMTFINVDGRERIIEHILTPGQSLSDTLVMEPYSLAAGKHSVSFYASTGYQNRKEAIEFFVRPTSTDFLEEGAAYFYNGMLYDSCYKLDIPDNDWIDIPLGGMRKVTLLTGLKSSNVSSHGLNSGLFQAYIESDRLIADYRGFKVENLKYYFYSPNTDKGECYAITVSLYPLFLGDGEIVIEFCDRVRRIPIRVTDPKDIIKL